MNRQKMQRVFLLQTNTCLGATKLPVRQGVAAIRQHHSGDNGLNGKPGISDGVEFAGERDLLQQFESMIESCIS